MIRTLQQRLALFLLLPVALLLLLAGLFGYVYARNTILREWREGAVLKLERAAHFIDMRLRRPIEWVEMFHQTGEMGGGFAVQEWLLNRLKATDGVARVNLEWTAEGLLQMEKRQHAGMMGRGGMMGSGIMRGRMMRFHRAAISEVTPPRHDVETGKETVTLVSELKDDSGKAVGILKIAVRFDYLLEDIRALGWWQSDLAGIVNDKGNFLAHTVTLKHTHTRLGEHEDPLELELMKAIDKKKPSGTLLGSGHPPAQVIGYYRLKQAPWTIVLFAPGESVLSPIIKFRLYYTIAGILGIALIIVLIRLVVGKMVRSIGRISSAAEKVAQGNYSEPLKVKSRDEMGQLTQSFNAMVEGLKERDFISNTFGRYVDQEIAKELMRRPDASRLGGEKREVAILISDIRAFTSLSESLTPEATISILNHYFAHLIEVIQKYRGIIVDFFGDGVLVFFDPLDGPVEPMVHSAVRCALEMQGTMKHFNSEMRTEGLPELHMGIGVNVGEVVVGNIGSETRAKYGIVGMPVNFTWRIQSSAEGGEVVLSESAYHFVQSHLRVKRSFHVLLKGFQGEIKLRVVEDSKPDP